VQFPRSARGGQGQDGVIGIVERMDDVMSRSGMVRILPIDRECNRPRLSLPAKTLFLRANRSQE
jgi:hypothetical protein